MLGRLFSRSHAKISPVEITNREVIADLDNLDSFPTLSATTARAMALMNNPNSTLSDMSKLIGQDGILAASILKRANNWTYRGTPVQTLPQAVMRLGLKECGQIVTAVGMRDLYGKSDRKLREACDTLLQHSYYTANLAIGLNRQLKLGFHGEEFTAGLLHDIGRIILCVKDPSRFELVDPLDYEDEALMERERRHFGTDHAALGALFATKNALPRGIGRAVMNHHRPADESDERSLVALVAFSERLANYTHKVHKATGYDLENCPGYAIVSSRWDETWKADFEKQLPQIVVHAIRETRILMKSTTK